MSSTFFESMYGTLFSPLETFDKIKLEQEKPVFEAFAVLVIVSIIGCIYGYEGSSVIGLGFTIVSCVIAAVISWVVFAGILDSLVTLLTQKRSYDTFLVLSAYSLLPWIFMGPASLFKTAGVEGFGVIGFLIGIILCLLIWLWTTTLFVIAVSKAYDISLGKVLALVVMPFLGTIIVFIWSVGFISNFFSILSA